MSGGELDYLYSKIQFCLETHFPEDTAIRKAFMGHMQLVIKALHDIEWVESGDMGKGDEEESILAVLQDEESIAQYLQDKIIEENKGSKRGRTKL